MKIIEDSVLRYLLTFSYIKHSAGEMNFSGINFSRTVHRRPMNGPGAFEIPNFGRLVSQKNPNFE